MDCLSIITSSGNNLVPVTNSSLNVTSKMSNPFGYHVDTTEMHLPNFAIHNSQNGFHGHTNGFGTNGAMNATFTLATSQNGYHQGFSQNCVKYPSMVSGNGFSIPCSTPFGSRKRSLADDDDSDECKRPRVSREYEANMLICNGGFPVKVQNHQALVPAGGYNTSAMEHQTTIAANHGYEDMYMYDILISQLHGC